jgi:hypothetical protein
VHLKGWRACKILQESNREGMQDFLLKLADSDGFRSLNSLLILLKIRCIAFETYANNLVAVDNNKVTDVFVRRR